MTSLGKDFGLQGLITKMLAVISDARIGQRTDKTAVVERLLSISGEDAISVQRKFLVDWFGSLPTRLQILTNELPALTEGSGALANRYIILIFLRSFLGREDPMLTDKLRTELQGILNWAIVGYRRLRDRGHFVQPANARELIEQIEMLGSSQGVPARQVRGRTRQRGRRQSPLAGVPELVRSHQPQGSRNQGLVRSQPALGSARIENRQARIEGGSGADLRGGQ